MPGGDMMRFIYEEHYQQPIHRLELVGDLLHTAHQLNW